MNWELPFAVEIDGKKYEIRNKCDYRVVLDAIEALNDEELDTQDRIYCALFIFYGNNELDNEKKVLEAFGNKKNIQTAIDEMTCIMRAGNEGEQNDNKPPMMNWQQDFPHISAPISRILGYSVRNPANYTHWYDFIGAYQEIGDCFWANVVSIRNKRHKGKKLEKWEQEFYREHRKVIEIEKSLTAEEQEWLVSDW